MRWTVGGKVHAALLHAMVSVRVQPAFREEGVFGGLRWTVCGGLSHLSSKDEADLMRHQSTDSSARTCGWKSSRGITSCDGVGARPPALRVCCVASVVELRQSLQLH